MSRDDDFLARWARRKQEARLPPQPEPAPPAEAEPAADPDKTEAEILEELGLPDPDTLGPGADFRAFMAKAVPDQIRRRALRRLWGTSPVLANLDELLEYGEDYTDKATVLVNLQSAYHAGRGYMEKLPAGGEETPPATEAEEKPPTAAEAPAEPVAEGPPDAPESVDTVEAGTAAAAPDQTDAAVPPEAAAEEDTSTDGRPDDASELAEAPPPRRRMRFAFDEG